MKIVSYIQDAHQEFDDLHSLVLFCQGCNFNCKHCYNKKEVMIGDSVGNAMDVITEKLTPLHEGVIFLGGEPTIWEDGLVIAAGFAKRQGVSTKLFTNGYRPDVVKMLLDADVIDAFSVDFKTVNRTIDTLGVGIRPRDYLAAVNDTIGQICRAGRLLEIRTTDFDHTDTDRVVEYVKKRYPGHRHIIQKPLVREGVSL